MAGVDLRASVVVPTYHRHDLLSRCLEALCNQSMPSNAYEVIVADDAADKATETLVQQFARTASCALVYEAVRGSHGPAAARNAGWRRSQGNIIAFTDDDCIPDAKWLEAGVEHLEKNPGDAAAWGKLEMPIPSVPTDYELDASGLSTAVFVTANCFVRRWVLSSLGGFDERFRLAWREDSDLCFSMLKRGMRVMYVPDALVVHPIRAATWGISLSQQRKSSFDVLLTRKHPQLCREHISAFPMNYIFIVLSGLVVPISIAFNSRWLAGVAFAMWLSLTLQFVVKRLRSTSRSLSHVLEMISTSILIPWLAIFYRAVGLWRFRNTLDRVPVD